METLGIDKGPALVAEAQRNSGKVKHRYGFVRGKRSFKVEAQEEHSEKTEWT